MCLNLEDVSLLCNVANNYLLMIYWVRIPDTVEPIEIGDDFDDYNTQAYMVSQQMLSHIFATKNPLNSNMYKVRHPHIIIQFNTVKYGS